MWFRFLQKIVKLVDPKLDKYREGPSNAAKKEPPYTPKTVEEFIGVLRRTPRSVIGSVERARIAAVMSFDERIVADLMIAKSKMVFVKGSEVLGPLTLDKLYKSGFTDFPVVDTKEHVVGILHTEAMNALEIRETDRADKYLDKNIRYVVVTDPLSRVVDEMKNSGAAYFLVRDTGGELVGFITMAMVLDYLLG